MNDNPRRSVPPPLPAQTDNANEADTHGVETTGSPPASGLSTGQPTVAGARDSSASPTEDLQQLGGYVVVKKIGEGGMGSVFLAQDPKLGRKVAIKTMRRELAADKSNRDRFEREARAAAAVEHENIVPILHIGEASDGSPFIAMPFLHGEMLDSRLKRDPVCNLGLLLKVAREVADGLAAAHGAGLIHRDIKPGNIWLEGDLSSKEQAQQIRRCKILDFGLARSVDKDEAQLTASGAILGTPAYMAPEQARGEKVDRRADLFSLGVMLYRMATGKMPFNGPNAMAVLIALTTETATPSRTANPTLPPALADLIDRLMSKDPAGRPQSAAEVGAEVRRIVKDLQAKKASSVAVPVQVAALPSAAETSASLPFAIPPLAEELTEPESPPAPRGARRPRAETKRSRAPWFIAAGVAALLALVAVVAVVVLRVETAEGTVVVEINDPDVEARIKNGKLVLVGSDGKDRYTITAADRNKKIDTGSYTIRVEGADGLMLDTSEFTLKKGEKITVRVTLDPKTVTKKDGLVPIPKGVPAGVPLADAWTALSPPAPATNWDNNWEAHGPQDWKLQDGELYNANANRGWIGTKKEYTDFEIELEYKFGAKGNSGIFLRAWPDGELTGGQFVEIQLIDDDAYKTTALNCTGAVFKRVGPDPRPVSKLNEWNTARVTVVGKRVTVTINGTKCIDADVDFPRPKGVIGLQQLDSSVYFRSVRVRELSPLGDGNGFVPLFNGKDLTGWSSEKGLASKWRVLDGSITCSGPIDDLFTDRNDFGDFHLRAEVKLNEKGNSGIHFRTAKPTLLEDYEAQICIRPDQEKTGSLWNIVKVSDVLVPADTWFTYEVIAKGNRIRLLVNGKETVDYTESRPGRRRDGYISLQQHDPLTTVFFRKIEIKELPPQKGAAEGFRPLFNGKDLTGWVADGNCKEAEWKADANGIAIAGGPSATWGFLLSKQDYTDFVMRLQFQQITEDAKSGIVVRGVPGQRFNNLPYQIKVNLNTPGNTGAVLWSNNSVYREPTQPAKLKPVGQWNDMEIEMRGQTLRVTVNGERVQDVDLDAFTDKPTALAALQQPSGRIGLQKHLGDFRFRNIEIKELPPQKGGAEGFRPLFNGKDLAGWSVDSGPAARWKVEDGHIKGTGAGSTSRGWLLSDKEYENFVLNLEFQVAAEADGGVGIRAQSGDKVGALPHHLAIKLTGYSKPALPQIGALYYWPNTWQLSSKPAKLAPSGGWNKLTVQVRGDELQVSVNGEEVQNLSLGDIAKKPNVFPGAKRTSGRVGLQQHSGEILFRNIEIKELPADPFQEKSVWVNTAGASKTLTVIERKGETFRALLTIGGTIERLVSGTVKDGKISWLAKDVQVIRGGAGGDNQATLTSDKDGPLLDFTFRDKDGSGGAFQLRLKTAK